MTSSRPDADAGAASTAPKTKKKTKKDDCTRLLDAVKEAKDKRKNEEKNEEEATRKRNPCKDLRRRQMEDEDFSGLSDSAVIDVGDDVDNNPDYKFQFTKRMKDKIQKSYPVIPSSVVEHVLKYGKPPFNLNPKNLRQKTCKKCED